MSEMKGIPVSKSQKSLLSLNEARAILAAALGDNSQKYFKHVLEWFKLRTSKNVIDSVARRYLKHEGLMHYHNVFILTLLNKVSGLNEKSLAAATQIVFPDGLVCPQMSKQYRPASPPPEAPPTPAVNVAQDSCLPSQALMHGRFIITTWEQGLQGVQSDAAELMLVATKNLLKNVLTVIVNDIKPLTRSAWSHMYHLEHNTRVKTKQVWYKEGEIYDEESLIEAYDRDALMNLLPKEGEPNYMPPEFYKGVPMSTSYGPQLQPEETESSLTLTACDLFNSLQMNPHIIPHNSICARTLMRASMNMRDKVLS